MLQRHHETGAQGHPSRGNQILPPPPRPLGVPFVALAKNGRHHPASSPTTAAFDIETMESIEPIEPPWQAIKDWIPDDEPDLNWFNQKRDTTGAEPEYFDQSPAWQPEEVPLGDGRTLILEDS